MLAGILLSPSKRRGKAMTNESRNGIADGSKKLLEVEAAVEGKSSKGHGSWSATGTLSCWERISQKFRVWYNCNQATEANTF